MDKNITKRANSNLVRIIVDSRDAYKNFWIDKSIAGELYKNAKLDWDETNKCHCVNERTKFSDLKHKV